MGYYRLSRWDNIDASGRPTHSLNLKFSISNFQFPISLAAPPRRELARTRIFIPLLFAAASVAVALIFLCAVSAAARPRVSITPVSYETAGDIAPYLRVRIAITNTGHIALTYNMVNFCDDAWLRTESARGWTNRDIQPALAIPALIAVLKPGGRDIRLISLPPGTLRWQVGYTIRAASLRQCTLASLHSRGYPSLYVLCNRFLPNREGPKQAAQSPVFEYPQTEPVAMNGWIPPAIGSEAAWLVPEPQPHP